MTAREEGPRRKCFCPRDPCVCFVAGDSAGAGAPEAPPFTRSGLGKEGWVALNVLFYFFLISPQIKIGANQAELWPWSSAPREVWPLALSFP